MKAHEKRLRADTQCDHKDPEITRHRRDVRRLLDDKAKADAALRLVVVAWKSHGYCECTECSEARAALKPKGKR